MKSSWSLIGVVALFLALPAAGQVYTQTRQTRQIATAVTARVPGQPDAADSDSHTSDAPGPFNQLVTSTATAAVPGSDPTVFASGNVEALGGFIPGADFMTGAFAANYRVDSRGGDAGGDFLLLDLDTEDPHGGPSVVFGYFLGTDTAWDRQLDGSGTLLAGHRYVLGVEADAGRELLNNPPLPGDHVSYGRSELTFRLDYSALTRAMASPFVSKVIRVSSGITSRP